jgi:molybdopterin converting factor small subunit
MQDTRANIEISVELFGIPRIRAGRQEIHLVLPADAGKLELVEALARECPVLVGPVLREGLTDLQDGYVFNHNGVSFLSGDSLKLQAGDFLLLLSSQAGG